VTTVTAYSESLTVSSFSLFDPAERPTVLGFILQLEEVGVAATCKSCRCKCTVAACNGECASSHASRDAEMARRNGDARPARVWKRKRVLSERMQSAHLPPSTKGLASTVVRRRRREERRRDKRAAGVCVTCPRGGSRRAKEPVAAAHACARAPTAEHDDDAPAPERTYRLAAGGEGRKISATFLLFSERAQRSLCTE
jgi:hypothetical protein